ncbi:MAG TPA: ribonuclease H-like domain-containing protein [Candidatus Bathyarchaeia archaeon]|nr:ribonuclease H-like domain-containing protein [Candidatus Bathyarchaeia archaeon]
MSGSCDRIWHRLNEESALLIEERDNRKLSRAGAQIKSHFDQMSGAYDASTSSSQFIPAQFYPAVECARGRALKRALIEKHKGKAFDEQVTGVEVINELGTCYLVETKASSNLPVIAPDKAATNLLADFKLLHGIRETTELALRKQGYDRIPDLVEHDRFGIHARRFLRLVETRDTLGLAEWVGRRFSRSCPLALCVSGFHTPDELLFVDIETLGLFASPVVIIGVAMVLEGALTVRQYVARDVDEEPAVLAGLLSHVGASTAFVTFNGKAFDVPFLEQRLAFYRIDGQLQRAHFDMLPFARRRWRGLTADCKLTSIERQVTGARESDISSALVPEFYETYLRTGNVGPLIGIVDHNRQDLIALAHIFSTLVRGNSDRRKRFERSAR